jgi:CHAT domain-containing protein
MRSSCTGRPSGRTAGVRSLPRSPWRVVACCIAAAWLAGCRGEGSDALLAELSRQMRHAPAITARLSISPDDGPPAPAPVRLPDGVSAFRAADGGRPERLHRLMAAAARRARAETDAGDTHALALIDLLGGSDGKQSLDRPISSLRGVAAGAEQPSRVLADLSAAYLLRAERTGSALDLLQALDAAEKALEHAPRDRAALFNRALAMERFGLVDQTAKAWRAYLANDSTTGWASLARRGVQDASAVTADTAGKAAVGDGSPQGMRKRGWCGVLETWGRAVAAGDRAGATAHLTEAAALGAALERRPGGDATLAQAVAAIRRQPPGPGLNALARAHVHFARGCVEEDSLKFSSARETFARAAEMGSASPALRQWARALEGRVRFHAGEVDRGETLLRSVLQTADTLRQPALAARARVSLSSILIRGDRYEEALLQAGDAARLFGRAGEVENQVAALDNMARAHAWLGEAEQGYGLSRRSLGVLRPYRAAGGLHNLLHGLALTAASDGLTRAALRVQEEGVAVAERAGKPALVTEALLSLARLRAELGDHGGAALDVQRAVQAARAVTDSSVHNWTTADAQFTRGGTLRARDPRRAAAAFDSSAAYFIDVMKGPLRGLSGVVEAAEAWLAAGEVPIAHARLDSALRILENRRAATRMEPRRASVFAEARAVVDRVVMLRLAAGDAAGALAYMDRGRASLAPVGQVATVAGPPEAPAGEVAVTYARVADTLLVWTVQGRVVQVHRAPVDTARLLGTIDGLRRRLEAGADEAEVAPALGELYDLLLRPVAGRLGGADTPLVIVADGEMAAVPFAALLDRRRGRYLVHDHPLRFAASLADARARAAPAPRASALLIADPEFAPQTNPGLQRLAGAAAEVTAVAAGYPRRTVLADGRATRPAVEAALRGAAVVHYAGHAVFDDQRPEASRLVLAPSPGSTGDLTADRLSRLDLRGTRLVVLSACETVRSGHERAAGYTGLVGALLVAGAGGALGTLWEVRDGGGRELMVEFHRAYRLSGDAARALRQAQLHVLRSSDPAVRSPSAWAAYRYMGG